MDTLPLSLPPAPSLPLSVFAPPPLVSSQERAGLVSAQQARIQHMLIVIQPDKTQGHYSVPQGP